MTGCDVNIIGAGLAGCEAAYQLAKRGVKVCLYDIKPKSFTEAHSSPHFAELVCSNSLKSGELTNACGLLKQEMRELDSLIISCADMHRVPAGSALAVDREKFAKEVTERIKGFDNINIVCREVESVEKCGFTVIATGPLTTAPLQREIARLTGSENLYFFDAAAPIVDGSTVDMEKAFVADRYGKGEGDYLNCPMDREEYYAFVNELISARTARLHEFEDAKVFEGCMPVEVMAKRGADSLRYGPLKPVGLSDKSGKMPFAVVQLRKENLEGSYYNLVGFQTNLLFSEQKRVFGMIPALRDAEFVKYGVMHRNTYINSPKVLDKFYRLKGGENIFFAGQICGVEGYVESASSGQVSGINVYRLLCGKAPVDFTNDTMTGALPAYISAENRNFQPMNANFAILKPPDGRIKDKKMRNQAYADRALSKIRKIKTELNADE